MRPNLPAWAPSTTAHHTESPMEAIRKAAAHAPELGLLAGMIRTALEDALRGDEDARRWIQSRDCRTLLGYFTDDLESTHRQLCELLPSTYQVGFALDDLAVTE